MSKPILAILSPNENAYSETFIQAHRRLLDADTRFYFGGFLPDSLDGSGPLQSPGLIPSVVTRLRRKILHRGVGLGHIAIADSFRREGVQVVLAEYGQTGVEILPVCRKLGIPLIVHFHGFDASVDSVLEQYRDRYQQMFREASAVIAVSRVMEQRLIDLGCPREKLLYNVYGPSDVFFKLKRADPPTRHFFGVGRFVDKKAPHALLLAFREVLVRYPDAHLTIGGDGPLRPVCESLSNYFEMGDRVSLPGVITQEQVQAHLAHCLAFVQHSVTAPNGDMEGTPVAILEASAAGVPVIATRHAGIPDVVVDGETGLLVDEGDIAGMARNMCQLAGNQAHARVLGDAGRRRIKEYFSMSRHIALLNERITSALGVTCPSVAGKVR